MLANLTNGASVNGGGNGSVNLSTIADNQFYARRKNPPGSRVNVVLGAQWGDEGKGKMVDMLATTADVVCRCQVSRKSEYYCASGRLFCAESKVARFQGGAAQWNLFGDLLALLGLVM